LLPTLPLKMLILAAGFLASLASGALAPPFVVALATTTQTAAAEPAPTPAPPPPSAIEQALIERACAHAPSVGVAGEDAASLCRDNRLVALRSDFGRDLSRLSGAERRKLDAACSRLQTPQGREAYLDCLHTELASLAARRSRANPQAPAEAEAAAVGEVLPAAPTTAPASSSFPLALAGAGLLAVAGAAGGVFVVRARRQRHACRVCHVRVSTPGDLCQSCRHDAAEALRRAAAERTERQRAQEEEEQRQRDEAEALRLQKERAEEDARTRRLEEARLAEEARRLDEETRQREEEAERRRADEFQRRQTCGSIDEDQAAFDPYRALGLAAGATDGQVRAAYEEARQKYDPEQVAHLGDDAQMHFAEKLRAVERAYRMLASGAGAPAVEAAGELTSAAS